jgi:hypothetical protein
MVICGMALRKASDALAKRPSSAPSMSTLRRLSVTVVSYPGENFATSHYWYSFGRETTSQMMAGLTKQQAEYIWNR